jgi:NAD(P)H-dependent FMN reductase
VINIVTILGSVRAGSNSAKALSIVHNELNNKSGVSLVNIDPAELILSLPGIENNSGDAKWLNETIKSADGIIIVFPEYHGSYSSVIKLIIDNLTYPSLLKEKPLALLGVANGQIGAIKSLEHLRSVCSHMGAIVLPGPVSIANVNHFFDEDGNCRDHKIEERIRNQADSLINYINKNICPRIALEDIVTN